MQNPNNNGLELNMTTTAKSKANGNGKIQTVTQRKRKLEKARQKYVEKNASENKKEKRAKLEKRRKYVQNQTSDVRKNHLEHDRISKALRRANENDEQRDKRLEQVRLSMSLLRSQQAPEQRAERLERLREYAAETRSQQTAEQRIARLERDRENHRTQRQSALQDLEAFEKEINIFADKTCEVCKKQCYPNQISRCAPSNRAIEYLPPELNGKDILELCTRCKCHITSNKRLPPPKAFWNNLDPGAIPDEINALIPVEVRILKRIIVFVKVVKYDGRFGQYGFKGQAVLFAQDVHEVTEKLPNMLPRSTDDIGMVVITECLENINITREFTICRERVYRALEWLIQHNPLYQDVTIDTEAQIDQSNLIRVQQPRQFEQPREEEIRRIHYIRASDVSSILRASWHQGNVNIFNENTAGKQCCAMALANVVRGSILSPHLWSKSVLDYNLIEGDVIYKSIIEKLNENEIDNRGYLLVQNFNVIKNDFIMFNQTFSIEFEQNSPFYGAWKDSDNDPKNRIFPLRMALRELFKEHKSGILIVDEKAYGVMNYEEKFYFTDSHSCGPKGSNASTNGRACVIECITFDELLRVCKRTTRKENIQYTLDYIDVYKKDENRIEESGDKTPQQNTSPNTQDTLRLSIPVQTSLMLPIDCVQPEEEDELEISDNINEIRRKTTNNIVNVAHEPKHEEFAWFELFPYGKNGLNEERSVPIGVQDYFQARLLSDDPRFQQIEYLFYALSMKEVNNVKATLSACAKKVVGQDGMVEDVHLLLQNLRGSAAYWRQCLSTLIAQIKFLGPPTYFITLSCNDLNWTDMRKALLYADKRPNVDPTTLTIDEAQKLVEKYPIVVARHFVQRFNVFKKFMKKNDSILGGKIKDYWFRIEFQNRGSPHIHMLVWIEDHPSFDTPEGIVTLDQVASCRMPDEGDELRDLVKKCQIHKHSHTCKKNDSNILCRFGFPRAQSTTTRIISSTSDEFIRNNGRICVLRRRKEDRWINNYNPTLLKYWQGNMDIQPCGTNEAIAYYVAKYISKNEPTELEPSIAHAIRQIQREETNIQRRLFKICMKILNERRVSAIEAAFRLCHLPLKESSRKCIFLNTRKPESRYRVIRFEEENQANGFCSNMFDRYEKRPEEFEEMCLLEFSMLFEPYYRKKQGNEDENVDIEVCNDEQGGNRRMITLNDNSKMVARNNPAVIRVPYFTMTRNAENYFYSLLVQYMPYRNESELIDGFATAQEAFLARENELKERNNYMELYRSRDEQLQNAFNQAHAFELLQDPVVLNEGEEIEEDLPDDDMTDQQFEAAQRALNCDQRHLLNKVTTSISDQLNGSAERIKLFVTGGAGTGKSFCLKTLKTKINRCYGMKAVKVCALTGVAARLIGGSTIHSLLKLPVQQDGRLDNMDGQLTGVYLRHMRRAWKDVEFLFIDEISMVPYEMLLLISSRLQQLKNNNELFGGINIIVFGDLMQLPPVRGKQVFEQPARLVPGIHLWRIFTLVELKQNMRQQGDNTFIDILNALRIGELKAEHLQELMKKVEIEATGEFSIQNALRVYPTNEQVHDHNCKVLENYREMGTEMFKIKAYDQLVNSTSNAREVNLDRITPADINKTGGLPKEIEIFVGAKIMLRSNINVEKGLVNGAIGHITEIIWPYFRRGQVHDKDIPSVKVDFSRDGIHLIEPKSLQFPAKFSYGSIERRMLPIILSWASTVHKMQGSTVDCAVVYLGSRLFAEGQAYVALSRVRSLDGLQIEELDSEKLTGKKPCNSAALKEMDRMRNFDPDRS